VLQIRTKLLILIFTRPGLLERFFRLRVSLGAALFGVLHGPLHPLLDKQLVLFACIRVWI
jgi:hypothetical protein